MKRQPHILELLNPKEFDLSYARIYTFYGDSAYYQLKTNKKSFERYSDQTKCFQKFDQEYNSKKSKKGKWHYIYL